MPLFIVSCKDKPGALALRMANREAHLAYAAAGPTQVKLGGPILDANGDPAGSMLIVEAQDLAAAQAFAANDPYAKAGLFGGVDVWPWKVTLGSL